MQGEPAKEPVQAVGPALHELLAETVACYVHHAVLVWERGDGTLWIFVG